MQYSQFSLISWYPRKTAHHFWQLLAVLSPPTLYIVETRNKFCILASSVVCGQREGLGMCELKKKKKQTQICLKTFVHHCRLQVSDEVIILLLHSVDEFDSYIVVSFINATLVLSIGETVEEVTDSGFLGTTPTLSCSQLGEDALLQVIQRRTSCESLALLG